MTTATKPNAVNIKTTKVFTSINKAWNEGKKGIFLEGGTYGSKTYSALQFLIHLAQKYNRKLDINVVSESIPHLKGASIKDFFNIMGSIPDKNPFYNITDRIYRESGWKSSIQFLSADNEKALGMRRDILFINEADTLSWEVAVELISRTNMFVIIDWNPRAEFWAHEYYKEKDIIENGVVVKEGKWDPKWAYDHSTYLDALDVIPPGKREDIEDLGRKDPNYHNVYELGLMGKIEGIVFTNFKGQVDSLPDGIQLPYGLDYGFAQDPTVLVKSVVVGDNLYCHQMFYDASALTNDDIAVKMTECGVKGNELILADPSEPKSAEELRRLGFNVQAIDKAFANTAFGIKQVNAYNLYWTKSSVPCIKETRNCHYIRRKEPGTGRSILSDDISHQWSHGMKGMMYSVSTYKGVVQEYRTTVPQRKLVARR